MVSSNNFPYDSGFLSISELGELPPSSPIIKDILSANSLAFLYGASGSYKSFIALSAALGIASGQPAWGRETTPGLVAYVVGEGQSGMKARIDAWLTAHNKASDIPFFTRLKAVDMLNVDQVESMISQLDQCAKSHNVPVRLLVVDTLATCFGDGDENCSPDVRRYLEHCKRVASHFDCCVLTVHHQGKDNSRGMRGHSSMWANADTVIKAQRGDHPQTAIMKIEKQKDGEEFSSNFRLDSVDWGAALDGKPLTSLVANFVDNQVAERRKEPGQNLPALSERAKLLLSILEESPCDGLSDDEFRKKSFDSGVGSKRRADYNDVVKQLIDRKLIEFRDERYHIVGS